jgi:peptide/nickel transport system ATP-binding protein
MSNMLEIRDLHVQYQTDEAVVHALNGFSLDLSKGETLGLVGETGAGKTTMALSILQLLPDGVGKITAGSIQYNNIDILKTSKREMREMRGTEISMIFQDPMTTLNPIMSVGDQIAEVLRLHFHNMSKSQQNARVDEIMTLVGIPPVRKDQFPHQFSGGMRQRIIIAMALVAEPKVILADEPTTALDVTIQAQILSLMQDLKEKIDSAMIFITHDLGIVAEFCDSVAIVYGGEVIENGSVEQVFTRVTNHPYTHSLFECVPDLTSTAKRLPHFEGTMLDPTNLPKGCKFALRCNACTELCMQQNPKMHAVEDGHIVKCHLFRAERSAGFE